MAAANAVIAVETHCGDVWIDQEAVQPNSTRGVEQSRRFTLAEKSAFLPKSRRQNDRLGVDRAAILELKTRGYKASDRTATQSDAALANGFKVVSRQRETRGGLAQRNIGSKVESSKTNLPTDDPLGQPPLEVNQRAKPGVQDAPLGAHIGMGKPNFRKATENEVINVSAAPKTVRKLPQRAPKNQRA